MPRHQLGGLCGGCTIRQAHEAVIQRREKVKHLRSPFQGLVPCVLDINGKWGAEAEAWLRRMIGELPEGGRRAARCSLRSSVAKALQGQ
eukprot:3318125-Pyramimonas_sp.AAC.1